MGLFLGSWFCSMVYVYIFMPAMSSFDYYGFVMKFEKPRVWNFQFFKISLTIQGLPMFHTIFFSISIKIIVGILIALNL